MKRKLSIKGLGGALLVSVLMASVATSGGASTWLSLTIFFVCLLLQVAKPWLPQFGPSTGSGQAGMQAGIAKEVWQNHIEETLYKDNEFLLASADASQYALQGKVVHIPQAGAAPGVEKNRSVFPATVTDREDTEVNYELEPYTTDPIRIPNAEKYELSYNKRESVIGDHTAVLRERIADEMLIKWAPTTGDFILRTSGEAVDATLEDTTGSRKRFTCDDLKKAQTKLNKQNVSKVDRYCLMSADMYEQFLDDFKITQNRDFAAVLDPATGVVGKLYGFNIMVRSTTVVYNEAASAVNAYGAATAATDNDAVLCWQKNCVERAVGSIDFFANMGDATFYGDVYSAEVRFGGRQRRGDKKGVVAIVQVSAGGV